MTIADLLYQAGFWQWVGILILVSLAKDMVVAVAKAICAKAKESRP